MKKNTLLIAFLAIISMGLHAQNITDTTHSINNVVIKGRKKTAKERAEFKRHGQTTEALTEEELNRNNPAFIEQSLGTMAGVQVDKRTQLGGQRIVIRGYGNDQKFDNWGIKVYFDGIPITTADGVTRLDDIDFSTVNNIEVIKGPAATMYGAGVGGVARFYLKNSDEKGTSLSQNTVLGSFGLFQSNTKLEHVTDKSSIAINYNHLQSDGYRVRGASLKNFFTFNGTFKLSEKHTFSAFMSHNFSHEGITGQIPFSDYYAGIDSGNTAYGKKNARYDIQTTRIGLSNTYKFNNIFSNTTSVFYSGSEIKSVSAGSDGNTTQPNYGLRSVFNIKLENSHLSNQMSLGTEIQQTKQLSSSFGFTGTNTNPLQVKPIASNSYFKTTTNQQSFFIHNRTNFKKIDMSLILGLSANIINYNRIDLLAAPGLVTGYTKDVSFNKSFDVSLNPHIALQKTYKNQIFNLSYSEGYNAPTASTSFIGTINKTNDSLKPEKARMIEFSAQGLLFDTKFDYQFSVFGMYINDKLITLSATDATAGTYSYTANTGKQFNKGFELSFGYQYEPKDQRVISKVTPFFNYSYYNFKYTNFVTGGKDYSNKTVVGVPKNKFSLGIDVTTKQGFYLNTTYNYMGEVYQDFANTVSVKNFGLLNGKIGFKHKFNNHLEMDAYMAGNNLTNQINYTYLFVGNAVGDSDPGSNFPSGVKTDVNPGPSKAYFFGGLNLKYKL